MQNPGIYFDVTQNVPIFVNIVTTYIKKRDFYFIQKRRL